MPTLCRWLYYFIIVRHTVWVLQPGKTGYELMEHPGEAEELVDQPGKVIYELVLHSEKAGFELVDQPGKAGGSLAFLPGETVYELVDQPGEYY